MYCSVLFLMVACSQDEDAKLAVNSNILKI